MAGTAFLTLPRLRVLINHANPSLRLPRLIFSGSGVLVGSNALSALTIPRIYLQATGLIGPICSSVSALRLPLLDPSGTGLRGPVGGTPNPLSLPRLIFSAFQERANKGTAILLLKRIKLITPLGQKGIVGSSSLTLPLLNITGHVFTLAIGSAALVLPTIRVVAFGEEALDIKEHGVPIRKGIAMNLVNWAVTEYTDYPFNSFALFNGVQLGAKEDGIFDLDHGSDDDGQDIIAYIEGPTEDLFKNFITRLREIWVESRQDGPLVLKIMMGEKETSPVAELPIESVSNKMHEERIKTPRGLKERYASFRIENADGSDVDIKRIKIFLEQVSRRR
jgi:hypothetical protein